MSSSFANAMQTQPAQVKPRETSEEKKKKKSRKLLNTRQPRRQALHELVRKEADGSVSCVQNDSVWLLVWCFLLNEGVASSLAAEFVILRQMSNLPVGTVEFGEL
jgi:hypothetical protein